MAKIFLSHSSRDDALVARLAADLREAGHYVWTDDAEIHVGHSIAAQIQRGLEQSDFIAVLLTRHSVASGWVEREWQTRIDREVRNRSVEILPIKADDCEVPALLRDKKYADLRDYETGLAELLRALDHHKSGSPTRSAGASKRSSAARKPKLADIPSELPGWKEARRWHQQRWEEMGRNQKRFKQGLMAIAAIPVVLWVFPVLLTTCSSRIDRKPPVISTTSASPVAQGQSTRAVRRSFTERWEDGGSPIRCTPGGCLITFRDICKSRAKYLRLGRTERADEFSYDLERCETDVACYASPDEIFPIDPDVAIHGRLEYADGSSESFRISVSRPPAIHRGVSPQWIRLQPVDDAAGAPLALARLRAFGNPYDIYVGAGGCAEAEQIAHWLYDIDGRGLVESKKQDRWSVSTSAAVFELPRQPSVTDIAIAFDKKTGQRVGPFLYRFDETKIVRAAAKEADPPRLACERISTFNRALRCGAPGNGSPLAWLDVREVRYGADEKKLERILRIDVTEHSAVRAIRNDTPIAHFDVPSDWKDVYYRLLLANGELSPTIRVVLQEEG